MVIQMRPNGELMSDSRFVGNDSTKPAAMAIPKEGFLKREDGRYDHLPQDAGVLRLHDHREGYPGKRAGLL